MKNKSATWQERRAHAIRAAATAVLVDPSSDDQSVAEATAALEHPDRALRDGDIARLPPSILLKLRALLVEIAAHENEKGATRAPHRTST